MTIERENERESHLLSSPQLNSTQLTEGALAGFQFFITTAFCRKAATKSPLLLLLLADVALLLLLALVLFVSIRVVMLATDFWLSIAI